MAKNQFTSPALKDGEVKRSDVNVSTVGSAVIAKVVQGDGISLSSTGADAGTGDVTIAIDDTIARQMGIAWTIRTSAADNSWYSVAYGNGLFVAVAQTGTGNRVMTSPDGITWTIRTSAADINWTSVTYGNGLFVAVASSGTGNRVMTSPDGITWTSRTSAADNNWAAITYGNGLFVAVAYTGTGNRVMTSADGITWTIRTSAADNSWVSVTYGNGLFVAVAQTGTGNRVMTSPDGITWTIRTSAADIYWTSVTYGNGLFVAVAGTGTGNRVMTSPDGITWTIRTSAADNSWNSVTYGNGLFVAVAFSGTGNRVMTSGIFIPSGATGAPSSMATSRILGRATAGTGPPEVLTGAQVRTILGLATTDSPSFAGLIVIGNVGIMTGVPQTLLHVTGPIMAPTDYTPSDMFFLTKPQSGTWGQVASFRLGRYGSGSSASPRSQLDIALKNNSDNGIIADTIVMSLLASGLIGIGTTTPSSKLSINGGLHVGGDSDAGDNNAIIDGTLAIAGGITDATNIPLGTGTGTKWGINATQKQSWWNATPVVQPTAVTDASGGAIQDAEARTALNGLLAKLRTIGIIAT